MRAIERLLHRTVDGNQSLTSLRRSFPGSPGEGSQHAYTQRRSRARFRLRYQLKNAFKSYTADGTGNITGLRVSARQAGLIPSDKSLVFVENHDTERGSDTLSYKDGATNTIANEFMLAYGYGTPQVYSGFAFDEHLRLAAGRRERLRHATPIAATAGCASTATRAWSGMVGWHNCVGNAPITQLVRRQHQPDRVQPRRRGFFSTNNRPRTPARSRCRPGCPPARTAT